MIKILSTYEDNIASNPDLLKACGFENDPHEENERYFDPTGDLWACDPDYVQVGGLRLSFARLGDIGLCDFDTSDYPQHTELVKRFFENPRAFDCDCFGTWKAFDNAPKAIAYRGGAGYSYAIYTPKD